MTFVDDFDNDHICLHDLLSSIADSDSFANPHSSIDGFAEPCRLMALTFCVAC